MYFRQVLHEEKSCASYLVGCITFGVCAVVDPQGDPRRYVEQAGRDGMRITHVVDTHIHADHHSAARSLATLTGSPIYLGVDAPVAFEHVGLLDEQVLEVGNRRIRVMHTPGHTPEHVCLLGDEWYLLTGDTLFVGDVGRVDLAGDNRAASMEDRARQLFQGLHRLLALPDWIEVYPGHYAGSVCGRGMDGKPASTVGRERRFNRPLAMEEESFIRFQLENPPPLPEELHAIKRQNAAGA